MLLVMLAAAAVILGGVVAVVMGRGGEITLFARDLPAARFRIRTPSDVALLRLPTGLFGFQEHATGEALREIARLLADRDAEIARLREDVRQLEVGTAQGAVRRQDLPTQSVVAAEPVTAAEPVVTSEPVVTPEPEDSAGTGGWARAQT